MHFSEISKEKRQDWLSRLFHFPCSCKACTGDWPTFDHLDSNLPADLKTKLQVVEKCIQSALGKGNLALALDLHLKDQRLLEDAGLCHHHHHHDQHHCHHRKCRSWPPAVGSQPKEQPAVHRVEVHPFSPIQDRYVTIIVFCVAAGEPP